MSYVGLAYKSPTVEIKNNCDTELEELVLISKYSKIY